MKLVGSWGQKGSKTAIQRHLHHHKLFGRVSRKKPLLSSKNKLKHLQFARLYWNFKWDRVLWSDETKIELFGNKHQRWVWRTQRGSHMEKYLMPTVKYGGGSLIFWGCFSAREPGHLVRIHGIMYSQILNEHLIASARKLKMGRGWTMIQNIHQNQHKNGLLTTKSRSYPGHPSSLTGIP